MKFSHYKCDLFWTSEKKVIYLSREIKCCIKLDIGNLRNGRSRVLHQDHSLTAHAPRFNENFQRHLFPNEDKLQLIWNLWSVNRQAIPCLKQLRRLNRAGHCSYGNTGSVFGYISDNKTEGCKKFNIWKELDKISNVPVCCHICKDSKLLAKTK